MKLQRLAFYAVALAALVGCSSMSFGIAVPIGSIGGAGVSVNTDGWISGGVGVGGSGGAVSVGGSGQLPPRPAEPAASQPR